MSVEKIKEYYERCGYDQHIHMFMALQCGPLLKGMVNTSVVTLDNRMIKAFQRTLSATRFHYSILYRGVRRSVIFIYDADILQEYLMEDQIRDCLQRYGYLEGYWQAPAKEKCAIDLDKMCRQLAVRMERYYNKETAFPHEIGFFLQYPPKDVEAFIENKGQNYLLSGYWKVYHDAENAQARFQMFDKAREEAVEEVLNGRKYYEIVA